LFESFLREVFTLELSEYITLLDMSFENFAAAEDASAAETYDASDNCDSHVNKKSRLGVERWTKEEEDKLLHCVTVVGSKNWEEVVKLMDTERSSKAYYHKYQDLMRAASASAPTVLLALNSVMGPSSTAVDADDGEVYVAAEGDEATTSIAGFSVALPTLLQQQGLGCSSYNSVPSYVPGVGAKAPKEPISSGQAAGGRVPSTLWTAEEDAALMDFIADHLDAAHIPWSRLDLPLRTRKACCNRWDYLMKNAQVPRELLQQYLQNRAISDTLRQHLTPLVAQMGLPISLLVEKSTNSRAISSISQTCQTDDFVGSVDASSSTDNAFNDEVYVLDSEYAATSDV
jgi:hypothetical protein